MAGAESEHSEKDKSGWIETTVVVLNGVSKLFADYLELISTHDSFHDAWATFLGEFEYLLKLEMLDVSCAVFNSLQVILSKANLETKEDLQTLDVQLAWELWSSSLPPIRSNSAEKRFDNQSYLLAYVSVLTELYRLTQHEIDSSKVQRILALLREALRKATVVAYSADIEYLTPLQIKVLESLRMIRTDISGVPSAMISQIAEYIALAFETGNSNSDRPTYIALSKAAMEFSESLIVSHCSDPDIYDSGAVSSSLVALAKPIVLKYSFPTLTKSIPPWKQATTSSLAIAKSILPRIVKDEPGEEVTRSIWAAIVTIANGIMAADCENLAPSINVIEDQDFDVQAFRQIRDLITPALGSPTILDKTRRLYTESLFYRSIIHLPQPDELPQLDQELLATLYKPRRGRTVDPPPSIRRDMCYVCLDELISLVALHDSSVPQIKLAQAAAPYLILRSGLTLKAYIADHPLRGRLPQPNSQRKELLYILQALVRLKCEPNAIPDAPGVESEGKKHLHRLYPLIAKAVRTASRDMELLEWLGRALDEVGMEFGVGA